MTSSRIWLRKVFSLDSVTSARCTSSSSRFSFSRWRCTSSSTSCSGTGMSRDSSSLSTTWSRAWVPWPKTFDLPSCSRMSSFSSPIVSNWLAIWAKSSSAVGSSRSFTASSLTVIWALSPSLSPPRRVDSKVVVSLALSASSASSMPSSSSPEPISYDTALAVSTSLPSISATRSSWAKSPAFAGRSTVMRVPKRLSSSCNSVSTSSSVTSTASTVSLSPSSFGRVNSGRTSTSMVTSRSPLKSFTLGRPTTSASGRPSGRIFCSSTAWR